jgi:hypothetical protein
MIEKKRKGSEQREKRPDRQHKAAVNALLHGMVP